ncbi:tail fiber domain-containing protein [Spartinivicinus poritis]|uniref:Tail fiber domain-containing protein n=1 Tax=Spartinivicinus poritis TaxID=2994640 RepID=A0ABT5U3H6_9GAMM|nr:tail fiber domain-containing protein [Spartinivicinus sp. A2-2]MDE1460770.1 tail fiber domain-containing protein [Spartinivicinus sp. A2-2]
MKLSKLLLTSAITLSTISTADAKTSTSKVYCGKVDGSDWYWLYNEDGSHQTVTGEWHIDKVSAFAEKHYLTIEFDEYIGFQSQCKSGYYAHPGWHSLSAWHRFKVNITGSVNDDFFYASGRESLMWPFNPSDIRLKQNIQPLQDNLDKVSRLHGYSYSWRPDSIQGHLAGQYEYGVIAQEIQAEFPALVKQDAQGYLRVDYRGLVPVLLESIKALKARVEALEAIH